MKIKGQGTDENGEKFICEIELSPQELAEQMSEQGYILIKESDCRSDTPDTRPLSAEAMAEQARSNLNKEKLLSDNEVFPEDYKPLPNKEGGDNLTPPLKVPSEIGIGCIVEICDKINEIIKFLREGGKD